MNDLDDTPAMAALGFWCVVVDTDTPMAIGPFVEQDDAQAVCDTWNARHPGSPAMVEPLISYNQADGQL